MMDTIDAIDDPIFESLIPWSRLHGGKVQVMSALIRCRSFIDVVYALGGNEAVAEIVGCTPAAVCNWKSRPGRFPAKHYAVIAMALHERGFFAPWSLFAFAGIERKDAA